MNIYLVKQTSCVDGEYLFNAIPCATLEKAREVMQDEINTLLDGGHFKDVFDWEDGWTMRSTEDSWYVEDEFSNYSEFIEIEEATLQA